MASVDDRLARGDGGPAPCSSTNGSSSFSAVSVSGDVATVHIAGGGSAGNPVTSGILTSSNSTLRLTLNDASTVDINVAALNNVSPVALAKSSSYFYLNSGVQLASNEHDPDNGVAFYGTILRRGNELVVSTPGNSYHVGIWNAGNGITGIDNTQNKSNWQIKWQYNANRTDWEAANSSIGPTGVEFAKDIQASTGKPQLGIDGTIKPLRETLENPGGGSTDVGDVSWNVPNINLGVTTAPIDTPWHSWAVVACGGMSIGHKGTIYAAKAMAITMSDLYKDHKLIKEITQEYKERKGNEVYEAMIDGPAPIDQN